MTTEKKVGNANIKLVRDDVTLQETDAFVYYAQPSLELGSGFGNAISMRGGPKIQEELKEKAPLHTGQAVATGAGMLKAKWIIHAVGPRFQESDAAGKLRNMLESTLKVAEEKEIQTLALPPLGHGFYGVPLPLGAKVTLDTLKSHLAGDTKLKEVVICCTDSHQMKPYQAQLETI